MENVKTIELEGRYFPINFGGTQFVALYFGGST